MEIYAELTKRLCGEVNQYGFFPLPKGVRLSRKRNSRYCYFACEDAMAAEELIEILDSRGIPWQEN